MSRTGETRKVAMNYFNYLYIIVGAVIGFLIALYLGANPTDMVPILVGIVVGLVAAFILKSRSEEESNKNRGASPLSN